METSQISVSDPIGDKRIYVQADGPLGQFVAHSLRTQRDPPPVTLLLHTSRAFNSWRNSPRTLALQRNIYGIDEEAVDVQMARGAMRMHGKAVSFATWAEPTWKPHYDAKPAGALAEDEADPPDISIKDPIQHLIIATKAQRILPSLLAIRHRLSAASSVLILTTGLGTLEQLVTEEVFPNENNRPTFLLGDLNHNVARPELSISAAHPTDFQMHLVRSGGLFITTHPLQGTKMVDQLAAPLPEAPYQSDYLTSKLISAHRLSTTILPPLDIHMMQLEKLAISATLSPLTSLLDAPNASMVFNHNLTRAQRLLLAETSLVLRNLPELRGHPTAHLRFAPDRLENVLVSHAFATPGTATSMQEDVRRGRATDAPFINGYIVRRGEQLGLRCFLNHFMELMVQGKQTMVKREMAAELQLENDPT
ncbi:6-phosphogluconate dehydrogenase C-terminal domain-like protein [Microthyrium microscopicum]|uniref:6-phosphogluconate dehydrogenase C-terminal domain-like protein n=1 Tax=Microthyrium microscopicum TaxID=703497 RepID=A0A6A6USL1_9PEZI|nr:6-phosphogluconate dehydrogenase C-terminal domain-like protein [Microthyrium microscopicum]